MLKSLKYIPYLLKQYHDISRFEKWSKAKIERYQINAFQKIFERAKQIPFYRELYKQAGVLDAKINTIEDIKLLPTIDKALCRENGYEDYFIRKSIPNTLVNNSSGSTGKPFQLKIPASTEMLPPLKVIYAMRQFGWKPLYKGVEIWRDTSSTHKGIMRNLGLLKSISIYRSLAEIKEFIEKENPEYLFSYRNFYFILMEYFEESKFQLKPKFLLCTAEEVTSNQREMLESYFQAKLINVYGCIESPTIAYTCPENDQFHVFQTTVILEVENQRIVNGVSLGDIVITNLTNDIMPFIRYKTGDTVTASEARCLCGRNSQIIGDIYGRSDDGIRLNNGIVLNYQHLSGAFRDLLFVTQYKAIYSQSKATVEFQFKLKANTDCHMAKSKLLEVLEVNFKSFKYDLKIIDAFEVSRNGKFKVFEVVD